jgi:endonuclease/exonuclease/phosphatase family metal-dependent hydrolase
VSRRDLGVVALVAAIALGLPAAGLNVAALAHREQPPVPTGALRIVAWNTEYWDFGNDPRLFTRYLVGMHADVYLLQEYLTPRDGPVDDRARLARDFPGYSITVKHELVVLSRLPVVGTPPVDARSVLRVDVRAGRQILSLYDVHMPTQADFSISPLSPRFYRALHRKNDDRTFLLRALDGDVRANPRPLLVAGDFNTTPAMGDLDTLAGMTEDAARASRQLYPRSWHDGPLHLWRLDWTRTAHGVAVHRYEFRDPQGMSDHDAQVSEITLPAPGAGG